MTPVPVSVETAFLSKREFERILMGSKKIGKGGKGKPGGISPGEADIVTVELEKQTAVNLFLSLAAALHFPNGKKKGKKGKKGGKGTKGGKGLKGVGGAKGSKGNTGAKGAKGSTGAKGAK